MRNSSSRPTSRLSRSPTPKSTRSCSTRITAWKEVDCKYGEVPAAIVPQQIRDYVAKNFAGRKIVSIDRDKRDWEVKLDNGLDLKFDLQFRLIEIDD